MQNNNDLSNIIKLDDLIDFLKLQNIEWDKNLYYFEKQELIRNKVNDIKDLLSAKFYSYIKLSIDGDISDWYLDISYADLKICKNPDEKLNSDLNIDLPGKKSFADDWIMYCLEKYGNKYAEPLINFAEHTIKTCTDINERFKNSIKKQREDVEFRKYNSNWLEQIDSKQRVIENVNNEIKFWKGVISLAETYCDKSQNTMV